MAQYSSFFGSEYSIGIFGAVGKPVLHTLATTRNLEILYFDGQSATLSDTGTLDAQIALTHGEVPPNFTYDLIYNEEQRALDLCKLIADLRIDGVVRMNAGFEVLLCDLPASGVRELFSSNITTPSNAEQKANKSLPQDPNRQPPRGVGNAYGEQNSFEWLRSATWHYGAYGEGGPRERRVSVDPCKMVTFYDPALSSLRDLHHGRIVGNQTFQNGWGLRRGHRLVGIGKADVEIVKSRLRELTRKQSPRCSGVPWQAIAQNIAAQHLDRLSEIAVALSRNVDSQDTVLPAITQSHELSHAILYAYIEYPFVSGKSSAQVKQDAITRCSTAPVEALDQVELTASEESLYRSIKVVLDNLCHYEWILFEWSEQYTTALLTGEKMPIDPSQIKVEMRVHLNYVQSLLTWIGWDNWISCERKCLINVCHIQIPPAPLVSF
ncbi:hypothetical protein KJ359_005932 [Pestalotiopsis sp. 9143b]|nr:hypothetical protein KJ359_005932 [Pestalotiopsis sp. 9143b]